jgi:asparagine synthase (glutamine-hydrolysing)
MCGFTGFLEIPSWSNCEQMRGIIGRMTDTLCHRGPDDSGVWVDENAGVALGHRRLAILDLSSGGHQPMFSPCGQFVLAYNGEIYNYLQIRKELERQSPGIAAAWRGHSDTEVLLAAFAHWGVEETLKRSVGMFAFALWDRWERCLYLGRDRLGEKPLYYGWSGKTFLFGSELKALRAHPGWQGEIDRGALALFLRYNYIPSPYSIYKGIFKLLPGTCVTINLQAQEPLPPPKPYWSLREVAEAGVARPFRGSGESAALELERLLKDAIRGQMIADVPLGAFLSGGVDSSTVVALMQAQSSRPVRTFTIGFFEENYSEAKEAKAVARHLGTDHTELYLTAQETMAAIPALPTLYDEPFADSSQIPTYLLSQLTRRHVTVSLSGDGGDELFAGYVRYFLGRDIWNKIGWMPRFLRVSLAKSFTALSPRIWEILLEKLGPILPAKIKQRHFSDKLQKLAEVLSSESAEVLYHMLISHWKDPGTLALGAREPSNQLTDRSQWAHLPDFTQRMMYMDAVSYLPDDILVKVDRASMGVSLESRVPLLDHRVVEFAWRLPLSMKIHKNQGKWLLRQVLYKYVPKELIERPKMGFGIPIDVWLRQPLRDWAENLLDERRLRQEGFFNSGPIRQKWEEHLSGKRNWQYYLWDVLMFQAWLEEGTGLINSRP